MGSLSKDFGISINIHDIYHETDINTLQVISTAKLVVVFHGDIPFMQGDTPSDPVLDNLEKMTDEDYAVLGRSICEKIIDKKMELL